jgi:hypothetical protein
MDILEMRPTIHCCPQGPDLTRSREWGEKDNDRGHSSLKVLTCLLLATFLMVMGACAGGDAYRGQDFEVDETIGFYFPLTVGKGYETLPPEWDNQKLSSVLLNGAMWLPLKGTSIIPRTLTVEASSITWTEGDTDYSANGYRIHASCVLRIEQDAEPGPRLVLLYLPAVAEVGKALNTTPHEVMLPGTLASQQDFAEGVLYVRAVTIHESMLSAHWSQIWKTFAVIVVVLVLLALGSAFRN